MNFILILLFVFPFIILLLITFIIIRLLMRKNKGHIDYGNYSVNILENNTTTDNENND